MRQLNIICFAFALMPFVLSAQSVDQLFLKMPEELLPGFSESNKILLTSDTTQNSVSYDLDTITKVRQSNDYLELKTSKIGTLQIKLLPISRDSVIICTIHTVCPDFCDSEIAFYTTLWQPLPKERFLPTISKAMFFTKSANASTLPDIYPIKAECSPNNNNITLILNYGNYLSDEMKADADLLMKRQSIVLKWSKNGYKKK